MIGLTLRFGFGLLLGWLASLVLGLEGIDRTVLIACAAAPMGYNTLTYASLEELDKDFAASMVSFSVLLGLIATPILVYFV